MSTEMKLVVVGRVRSIEVGAFEKTDKNGNIMFDADGKAMLGPKQVQIMLMGNVSYRVSEGDEDYPTYVKKIAVGYELTVESPYHMVRENESSRTNITETGGTNEVVTKYVNLGDTKLLAVRLPTVDAKFNDLPDVEEKQVAVKTSTFGKSSGGASNTGRQIDTSALTGGDKPPV